jgi:hypothetical protein
LKKFFFKIIFVTAFIQGLFASENGSKHDTNKIFFGINSGIGSGTSTLTNTNGNVSENFNIFPSVSINIGYGNSGIDYYFITTSNFTNLNNDDESEMSFFSWYINYGIGIKYDVLPLSIHFLSMSLSPTIAIEQQYTTFNSDYLSVVGWGSSIQLGVILKTFFNTDFILAAKYDKVFWDYPAEGVMYTHDNLTYIFGISINFNLSSNIKEQS